MQTITDWTAKRSGGRITIYGKDAGNRSDVRVPNVDTISQHRQATSQPEFAVIAKDKDGTEYRLVA